MIVCICNNINDKAIANAVLEGATSVEAIREVTTASACCGKCQFKIARVISDTLTEMPSHAQFYNAVSQRA